MVPGRREEEEEDSGALLSAACRRTGAGLCLCVRLSVCSPVISEPVIRPAAVLTSIYKDPVEPGLQADPMRGLRAGRTMLL